MQLDLFRFQERATEELLEAVMDARSGHHTALILSAPTGSGKTVIATAALEQVRAQQPTATFLWVSVSPELNEQTREKMLQYSDVLGPGDLVVVDEHLNVTTQALEPGRVYFLNTQKLARTSRTMVEGDERPRTLWDILEATTQARPVVLFIDEAHSHTGIQRSDQEYGTKIRQLITGNAQTVDPTTDEEKTWDFTPPGVVVGISATPDFFQELLNDVIGSGLISFDRPAPISVTRAEVRDEKILKSSILVDSVQDENTRGDITLLKAAVSSFVDLERRWAEYTATREGGDSVDPILVIQVEDRAERADYMPDFLKVLETSFREAGSILDRSSVRHAFSELGELYGVDSIPASEIQADHTVRVVLFKTALTAGWDCPRAELLLSFRSVQDETSIIQLVGRMVRNPLVQQVPEPAYSDLNQIRLFLPNYNERVLRELTADYRGLTAVKERKRDRVMRLRTDVPEDVRQSFASLKTVVRTPRKRLPNRHRVLLALLRTLARDGKLRRDGLIEDVRNEIAGDAVEAAREALFEEEFLDRLEGVLTLRVREHEEHYSDEEADGDTRIRTLPVDPQDIERSYEEQREAQARQKGGYDTDFAPRFIQRAIDAELLTEFSVDAGIWDKLADYQRLQAVYLALVGYEPWAARVEAEIETLLNRERNTHRQVIDDADLPSYAGLIDDQPDDTRTVSWSLPAEMIPGTDDLTRASFEKSALLTEDGEFVAHRLTGVELETVQWLEDRDAIEYWVRNPTNGGAGFAVPYHKTDGSLGLFYPDFLAYCSGGALELIESKDLGADQEARNKWKGLVDYGREREGNPGRAFDALRMVFRHPDTGELVGIEARAHRRRIDDLTIAALRSHGQRLR